MTASRSNTNRHHARSPFIFYKTRVAVLTKTPATLSKKLPFKQNKLTSFRSTDLKSQIEELMLASAQQKYNFILFEKYRSWFFYIWSKEKSVEI